MIGKKALKALEKHSLTLSIRIGKERMAFIYNSEGKFVGFTQLQDLSRREVEEFIHLASAQVDREREKLEDIT